MNNFMAMEQMDQYLALILRITQVLNGISHSAGVMKRAPEKRCENWGSEYSVLQALELGDRLGAAVDLEFLVDASDVVADGVDGDPHVVGDAHIRVALGEADEDIAALGGQGDGGGFVE